MLATLTDDGLETLKRVAPHHVASVRRHIFDHLNKTQVVALDSIFASISEGLKS